ncbi:serine/threonine-protein kinase [Streptomyces sp. ZSW22]|uniref:serine/threonine-protein kinase n=1 Tax=Streptomyces TaxID=1883 RepID=UPI0025B0CB90|nr:serine/threonine-protein kinase [Streptomyces sp. ZSW22]MDN3247006.1 serine/threonine-protein kinase [Streptomyces sp. ZSW22]
MQKLGGGDPRHIGAYRLLGRLGAGGMGHVYLARSDRGRTVAVKLVREELAAQEEFRERFRKEVESARRVGGHWTAPVLDADTEAAVPWVATGYVAGPSLQQVVGHDHGALPERSVRTLAAGLAHALQDIHAAGIIHRDLKPSNVLVTIDGPRVIDFGIARALQTVTDGGLTRTGALVGSPGFMAPEQVRGDRITPACDVFCLGSVIAYAATGELPFGAANSGVHALMFRIAQEEPDLDRVPEGLADLVRDCLKKDPAARPALAEVLARTGAEDTVADGRSREPWLPGALVAQLGRHAVRLLDAENPESPAAAAPPPDVPDPDRDRPSPPDGDPSGPPPPREPGSGGGAPLNHLPTLVAGQSPPAPPPASHGHASPYGAPQPVQHPYGGLGSTPPYGPPPHGTPPYGPPPYGTPPYGPPHEPAGRGRSTALLVVVALVVALGAGGSVYALMSGQDDGGNRAGGDPTSTATAVSQGQGQGQDPTPDGSAPTTEADRPTTPTPRDGTIPTAYLGTWSTTIDNASGVHTRRLTIQQGEVGDTVLSLVADGPAGSGSYHCVFEADLSAAPDSDGPLSIGPSTVTVGPAASCAPGEPTTVTLLPNGSLRRVNNDNGESLTYTRE